MKRKDKEGNFWEAIAIGFAIGVAGQFIKDVIGNYQQGKTGLDLITPTSSLCDYLASGAGTAIAAIPGLGVGGTIAAGAFGRFVTDLYQGKINTIGDMGISAFEGASDSALGLLVQGGLEALKVKYIDEMGRWDKKIYLRDNVFKSSQSEINRNLHYYTSQSFAGRMNIIRSSSGLFKSGIITTSLSTAISLLR